MIKLRFFDIEGEFVGEVSFQSLKDFEFGETPIQIRNRKFPNAISAYISESDTQGLLGIEYDFLPVEELNAQ